MQIRESDIRDSLSENLEILEQGLKLVDKERYLPNIQGTRGYVDILAQDKNNKHVLIEIKRSRASSREALHEILKYFEALKTNLCARDSEIRMFIVSTEWTELLVPFSSFVKRVDCEVTGYFLETDNDGNPANSTIVEPLELADDRLFAPWHEVNYYTSELSLEEGIRSYERTCKLKGIRNFVLVILQAKEGRHQRSVDALKTYLSQLGQSMGFDTTKHSDFVENQEEHKYLAYFAHIVLPASACLDFIKKSLPEVELQEFLSYIEGMDNGEQLTAAHEKLHDASPRPKRDYFDIGYPSKFSAFLAEEDGWEVTGIRRYGALEANKGLTDEAIINDLSGDDGASLRNYRKSFTTNIASEVSEVRTGVKRCLRDNTPWRTQILQILDEISSEFSTTQATIEIFNPGNLCFSLYNFISNELDIRYLPSYSISLKENNALSKLYFGTMRPNGTTPSFTNLLDLHFDGEIVQFLLNLSWGGYLFNDVSISEDIGMSYRSYKFDAIKYKQEEFLDYTWKPCDSIGPWDGYHEYIFSNRHFTEDIMEIYSSHWDGNMWRYEPDTPELTHRT